MSLFQTTYFAGQHTNRSGPARRCGFTLIELLIVIAIIGVLATLSVAMLSGAANDAKISATQARISQIQALLKLHMEDYEVRKLPISRRVLDEYIAARSIPPEFRVPFVRNLRRQILLDMINAEMPRAVRSQRGGTGIPVDGGGNLQLAYQHNQNGRLGTFPSECNCGEGQSFENFLRTKYQAPVSGLGYLHQYLPQVKPAGVNRWGRMAGIWGQDPDDGGNLVEGDARSTAAEYLYEILKSIDVDGISAIETLGANAVGDFDGDGYREIVDAWGEPMVFDIEQPAYVGPDPATGLFAPYDPDAPADPGDPININGFVPLDPRMPARLDEVRFVVGSFRVPETLPLVEQAALGLVQVTVP